MRGYVLAARGEAAPGVALARKGWAYFFVSFGRRT